MEEKETVLNKRSKRVPKSTFVWSTTLFLTQTHHIKPCGAQSFAVFNKWEAFVLFWKASTEKVSEKSSVTS